MSARTTIWVKECLFGKEKVKNLLPGFIVSVVLMVIAQILSNILNLVTRFKVDPFNPILITVILGMIFRNSFLYSEKLKPGVEFGIRKLLRFGIILMGIRLSFLNFVKIGFTAAGMVIITISSVISITAGILTSTDIAITTKLVRNTMMLIVIPLMSVLGRKNFGTHGSTKSNILKFIPLFVLGYILMGVLRSVGDYSFGVSNSDWINTWETITGIATYIIAISITCVGLNTNVKKLVKLNIKPLIVGFVAALCAGIVSYALIIVFAG